MLHRYRINPPPIKRGIVFHEYFAYTALTRTISPAFAKLDDFT
nr:MAG TPA: hypothetical protein [Caudoviricetes sp.]